MERKTPLEKMPANRCRKMKELEKSPLSNHQCNNWVRWESPLDAKPTGDASEQDVPVSSHRLFTNHKGAKMSLGKGQIWQTPLNQVIKLAHSRQENQTFCLLMCSNAKHTNRINPGASLPKTWDLNQIKPPDPLATSQEI